MPKYVVFNTVNYDGAGDFAHFKDIMKALLANPAFKDVEFTSIIEDHDTNKTSRYDSLHKQLTAMGIRFYLGNQEKHKDQFSKDKNLQKDLLQADQAIIISFDNDLFKIYQPYLKKSIPVKCIGEHETSCISIFVENQFSRGLGLSKYGIKIKDIPRLSPQDAWNTIAMHDPKWSEQLLKHTHSNDFESFYEKNILVPAYFNKPFDFSDLVDVFIANQSLSKDKNIIIFQSGFKYSNLTPRDLVVATGFIDTLNSDITNIEVIMPAHDSLQFPGNPDGSKTITIFSGFYLSDPAYDAIYHLAQVAGVSGDNSLELAVSMNVLPFYWSTNSGNKYATIRELHHITQALDITPEAKKAFDIFFSQSPFVHTVYDINFQELIQAWPTVTAYLRTHKNFYDKLEDIVLEGLPLKSTLDTRNITTDIKQKLLVSKEDADSPSADKSSNLNLG